MGLGKKNGLWENLYSPFRFGEKNASAKRVGVNDKFGKYIGSPELKVGLICEEEVLRRKNVFKKKTLGEKNGLWKNL